MKLELEHVQIPNVQVNKISHMKEQGFEVQKIEFFMVNHVSGDICIVDNNGKVEWLVKEQK